MVITRTPLLTVLGVTASAVLGWSAFVHADTTSVLTINEGGPTAFMNSGLNPKSFWSLGSGGSNGFSNSGNDAYSSQTGGDISPMEANIAAEKLSQFVVDEGGNNTGTPTFITGGQLVQLDGNQEFISELFGAPGQTGAPSFNTGVPENSPIFFHTVNTSTLPPGGYIYNNGVHTGTITVTVPTPEPAVLSIMALAGVGLALLSRRGLAKVLPAVRRSSINK